MSEQPERITTRDMWAVLVGIVIGGSTYAAVAHITYGLTR